MKTILTLSIICITIMSSFSDELPQDVNRIVNKRSKAIQMIDKVYVEELQKLKLSYMRKGDLKTSNVIEAMINDIDTLADSSDGDDIASQYLGVWIFRVGSWQSQRIIRPDGSVFRANKPTEPAKWITDRKNLIIIYPDGAKETFGLPKNGVMISNSRKDKKQTTATKVDK
ncbi:hypothetical protein JO972_16615 [Verrucomicrobiaceae bacterium 5K15]|uniref:Uncharacterized protein n=1 Tax=Oceaniferula flava TaxID=2800421 RepID=A0AAE2VF44_9BACT|nr:hypothetical protein [Oceaniferula flavus]MBK1856589.1 hypothetical protein [Oceaniferula flavus]MBM1137897.1 hypothetical protein [Oceaniferula flavus]